MKDKKHKILIIDDEHDFVNLIRVRLEENDYNVMEAASAEDGWQKLKKEKPSLIILDLMLPGIGGYEMCSRLKSDEKFAPIPVVMLTARGGDLDRRMGIRCGADGYVSKFFATERILDIISGLLEYRAEKKNESHF